MKRTINILCAAMVVAFAAGCQNTPSAKTQPETTADTTATMASEDSSQAVSWCAKGKEMPLGKWTEGGSDMAVSYCEWDSLDATGIELAADLDVRQQDKTASRTVWKIHDQTRIAMTAPKLFRPSYDQIDIDGDGTLETFFGYNFVTDGADPLEVKFMAHQGGKKFAIRGAIPMILEDSSYFKMEFDPAFATASPRLKQVADSLFRLFAVRLCEDPDLGYGIPVPPQLLR